MTATSDRIVVIGAGMGGLAAAARLAHAGCDVTVVEAQGYPGGKMRTVDSPAGPVDAGPTVMTMRHVFDALFADCGARLEDAVTLHQEPLLARHFWPDGATLDLYDDVDRSAEAVHGLAGARAEAEFRSFSTRAARLFDAFEAPMMLSPTPRIGGLTAHVMKHPGLIPVMAPFSSLASVLKRQFTDPRLRQLFGRYATYVGGSPFSSPAVLALIWSAEERGVWRVEGGMHRLARAMAALAEGQGARFRFGARAVRVERQSGAVRAVHLEGGERIGCDRVVFNGDPRALAAGLLGDGLRGAVADTGVNPRSLSARVWTFAATPQGPDLAHHNVFFGADPQAEFGPIARGRAPEDPTLYVCAQDRGMGLVPPDLERFEIIENAPPLPHASAEETETCRTRTFQALARFGLRFSPAPPDGALTTPQGFETLFPASLGSLYGRSPSGMRAPFQRPTARTAVPGLYLAGGGAHPGAGVPMATLSGRHAAEAILTDLASTSTSRATATPGGMSTASAMTAAARSRSSPS
ncbi:1-hydroxycarotenoid 3,4-desaturase CrtD [Palleronia sp. KMU-117]|uniref:1-hydroxycarotenoid 3,4-desaturase CrtD n=1 Tax=Palleronia sp. KMU-117 TaxID=3434108 RepID=UPI003D730DE4